MIQKKILIPLAILLALTVFLSYKPVLKSGFVDLDDRSYVTENPEIHELSWKQTAHFLTSFHYGLYKPLVILSYAVEYHFFRSDAHFYHLTNLLLHILNTLGVFWLLYLITKRNLFVSFLTAAFFGLHPAHVESVAWITERKDMLYSFFYIGGLVSYIYFLRTNKIRFRALALICLILSLMSKPMAVTFPLALLLLDVVHGRKIGREVLIEKIPFFILSAAFGGMNFLLSHETGKVHTVPVFQEAFRILRTISYNPLFYLYKIFVPLKLACIYPHPDHSGGWNLIFFKYAPLIFIFLLIAVLWLGRRFSFILGGFAFFGLCLIPVAQIVPFGAAIVADRYTYLSSIGIFYVFSEALYRWARGKKVIFKKILYVSSALLLVGLSVLTWRQCKVWENSFTLWDNVVKNYPMVTMAYCNRGNEYNAMGKTQKALADYNEALRRQPDYADVLNNRGNVYAKQGLYGAATADFERAFKAKPDHELAYPNLQKIKNEMDRNFILYSELIAAHPGNAENYFLRGNLYADRKLNNEALADYNKALELGPRTAQTYNNRGSIFLTLDKLPEALADFDQAIRSEPTFAEAYYNRAMVLGKLGEKVEAEKEYQKYLELSRG